MPRPLAIVSLLLLLAPATGLAADAHVGVHAERGEMVLLRDVNARPAYRPAPPGIAVIVDPTPNREINQTLGTGEMSDDEFAAMSSGQLDAGGAGATMPQHMAGSAVQGSLGRLTGDNGVLAPGGSFERSIGGATGAIAGATRGIGSTITGALSQFPAGGANPGGGR